MAGSSFFSAEEIAWRLENRFPSHFPNFVLMLNLEIHRKLLLFEIHGNGATEMLFNVTESNAPDIRSVRTSMRCWNDASEFSPFFLPCFL